MPTSGSCDMNMTAISPAADTPAMVKVLTKDLVDEALDWVIAQCRRVELRIMTAELQFPLDMLDPTKFGPEQIQTLHSIPTYLISVDKRQPVKLNYSTNWGQGGPIFEQEIDNHSRRSGYFYAHRFKRHTSPSLNSYPDYPEAWAYGPTLLIAGMRAYATAIYGKEVEIPKLIFDALHRSTSPYATERSTLLNSLSDEAVGAVPAPSN